MAVMSAIVDKSLTFDDLKKYEKNYQQGRKWKMLQKKLKNEEIKMLL